MDTKQRTRGSWVLRAIIIILVGVLVYVIYEPYQMMTAEEMYKKESRLRMMNLRTAELYFLSKSNYYTESIDSLVQYIKTDSLLVANRDSTFKPLTSGQFSPDSLLYTPKNHRPYKLKADNATAIKKYLLECPDGYGSIGSLTDESRINKGSWEE